MPLLAQGEKLDEKTLRTLITWIVDGTQIKGKPLVEIFPEAEEWMLSNFDPNGTTTIEKFNMEHMPMVLQEWQGATEIIPDVPEWQETDEFAGPVTFSFFFDEDKVNNWIEKEARMYSQIDKMYQQTWEAYLGEVGPLFQQVA